MKTKVRMLIACAAVVGLTTFGAVAPANAAPAASVSQAQVGKAAFGGGIKPMPRDPQGWVLCFYWWVLGNDCRW